MLVNSKGIRDAIALDHAMNDYASLAVADLRAEGIPDNPGRDYLATTHERMFQRIVPNIAGRVRDVNVQATGTGIAYVRAHRSSGSERSHVRHEDQ